MTEGYAVLLSCAIFSILAILYLVYVKEEDR